MGFLSKFTNETHWKSFKKSEHFPLFQDFELFKIFFDFEKKSFFFETKVLKSKICPGIQKSHLENRASILKLFNIKNPVFPTQIPGFPYTIVQCYVHRPFTIPSQLFQKVVPVPISLHTHERTNERTDTRTNIDFWTLLHNSP